MLIANRQSTANDSSIFDKYTRVYVTTTSEYTKAGIGITYREDASKPSIIEWGDGTVQSIDGNIDHVVHDYATAGDFIIKVSNLSAFSLGTVDMTWRTTTSQDAYTVNRCIVGTTVKLLLDDSFAYAINLSSIEMPNTLLSVGSGAFISICCKDLIFPDRVKYIGNWMCYNNALALTSVIFPDNAYMPDTLGTFCDCTLMTKYRLPKNITSFAKDTFNKCFQLTYVDVPSTLTSMHGLSFYRCTKLSCVNIASLSSWCNIQFIPYSSYGVTTMQPLNFAHGLYIDGQLVTDLSIPNGVKQIYDYAFYSCNKATRLEIPDTVSSIGAQGFYSCNGLSTVSFGSSVKSIGSQAFYNCYNISTLYLPDSLQIINQQAFAYCSKIKDARIPDGVSIEANAFVNLTSLNDMLFCGLATDEISSLSNYPWGIPTNKISAMHGDCEYAYVTYLDSTMSRFKIAGQLKSSDISNLQNATNIVVDDGLISIAPSAFANCMNLKYADLPQTLSAIGQNAFIGCSSLQSLTLRKKTVDKIQLMENYPWGIVDTSVIHGLQPTIAKFIDGTTSAYGVDVITEGLIQPANDVVEINVSKDVVDISANAFRNFSNLSTATIDEGLTRIGNYAFANCSSLTSIDVPDGVVSAGTYVFASCFNLVSAQLPDTLVNIGMRMFYRDTALHHVRMPNHISSLGTGTFMSCTSIISCEIPIGLTSIGTQTFGSCSNLKQVKIPWTVKNIATNAFIRCLNLSSITDYALSAPTVVATSFGNAVNAYAGQNTAGSNILHVPAGATGYEASYWLSNLLNPDKCGFSISYEDELLSPFLTKIEFVDGDLSTLNISEQVKTLYDHMEQWWDDNIGWTKWMTKIEIGNQFTTIQDSTFYELTTLTNVKIPYSIKTCEPDAFYGCTGLTSIVVEGKTIDEAKKILEGTGIPASCQITVT